MTMSKQAEQKQTFPQQKEQNLQRDKVHSTSSYAFTLAVQALQNGIPLQRLPPEMVLAFSSQIGNSALVDLICLRPMEIENTTGFPPIEETEMEPFQATVREPMEMFPPEWGIMPALQTAPAEVGGLAEWSTAF